VTQSNNKKIKNDLKNKSLYIKLAKETPRGLLEQARNFVKDAVNVKSPPKLYMWKLTELKKQGNKEMKKSGGEGSGKKG
jgi:hypothetical protein